MFGFGVALSWDGTTALIGAPGDGPGGAAWVFIRSGNTWTPQGPKLTSGQSGQGNFGISVALSADASYGPSQLGLTSFGLGADLAPQRTLAEAEDIVTGEMKKVLDRKDPSYAE